jgi:hypothetical protein
MRMQGLKSTEIEERKKRFGANVIPMEPQTSIFVLMWEALQDPTLLFLCFAAFVSLSERNKVWRLPSPEHRRVCTQSTSVMRCRVPCTGYLNCCSQQFRSAIRSAHIAAHGLPLRVQLSAAIHSQVLCGITELRQACQHYRNGLQP